MAVLFDVTFNLGPTAPLEIVAGAIVDLEAVGQSALRIAELHAEAEARRYLTDMVVNEGPQALISLVRQRELLVPDDSDRLTSDLEYFETLLHDLGHWPIGSRRSRWAALAAALFPTAWPGQAGPSGLNPVYHRLLAIETAERTPSRGLRVQSLRYENPVGVEILSDVGAAAAGLAFLLVVIRDWCPRRRMQAAHAKDAEDRVSRKVELRKLMLERIAGGELDIPSEALTDLLVDDTVDAAGRLAERELTYEQHRLPGA